MHRRLLAHPAHSLLAIVSALTVALSVLVVSAPATSAQEVTPARIGGQDRYDTAANVATFTFEQADVAHVVTGENFPDALSATFAAGSVNGPLLLSGRDRVPAPTWAALDELGVQSVVLVGGTDVLSTQVEQELADAGYSTSRLSGSHRYHTASVVARHYGEERVGTVAGQRTAILATGVDYPDALAAGPIAARERLPLLLTPHGRADASVNQALEQLEIDKIFLLGGPKAVSEDVEAFYRDRGYDVERIGGPTRMDTAWLLADTAVHDFGFTHELVLLARGDDYPDALTASVHGATVGAPIVLTATAIDLSEQTRDWLTRTCPDVRALRALGGTEAVSADVLDEAVAAAEACRQSKGEDAAVAVTDDGRVVLLDASSGEETRELMSGVPTDDPAKNDVAVTRDQAEAYVAVPSQESGGDTHIVRVPTAGGDHEVVVADGSSPAVSPDGSTLAYAVHVGDVGDPDPRLVLRNLVTGEEVRFAGTDEPLFYISDVEWTADGSEVVFTVGEINTGVYAVDRNATSMDQARRLGPGEQQGSDLSWRSTAAFGDDLAVVEMCCDAGFEERWRIISVDPADGSVAGPLVPEERIEARHLDSNADATGLLIVEGGGPGGGTLQRWHGSGSPQTVAHDVVVAAW